ncbi:MAG: OmpA family protein [Bdellovibrionales bacterium]|nr:OmpA family protein [Bdellovibrionales bacterium]
MRNRIFVGLSSLFLGLFSLNVFAQSGFTGVEEDPRFTLLSPNIFGATGLYRIFSAEKGPASGDALSFGFYGHYFTQNDFPTQDIETERAEGKITFTYTPIPLLEMFLGLGAVTSNNKPPAFPLTREVFNVDAGLKVSKAFSSNFLHAGLIAMVDVDQKIKTVTDSEAAISPQALAILTMDFLEKGKPIRLHINAGYRLDDTAGLVNSSSDERTRIIAKSLPDSVILAGFGAEYLLNSFTLNLEYTLDYVLSQSGKTFLDHPQRLSLGTAIFPSSNRALSIKAGGDLGFFATTKASRILREPNYGIHIGVAYQLGMAKYNSGGTSEVSSFDVPKQMIAAPKDARIFGLITDLRSGQPIAEAKIYLCDDQESPIVTDDYGNYRSYPLQQGACTLRVQKPGFDEVVETIQILGGESRQDFSLVSNDRNKGSLLVKIIDQTGAALQGEITFPEHPEIANVRTDEYGQIRFKINPGSYAIRTRVVGMKFQTQRVSVVAGQETSLEFVLEPEVVRIAEDRKSIEINSQIQFETGKAILTESGRRILDDVSALILDNPQIQKIEIAGHTDSVGDANANLDLSQHRAESVKLYLISRGVDAGKLEALGYGEDFPIASNDTDVGKTINRRVEFKILDQDN